VTNISAHGFWLLHADREYFLHHARFPWFKKANVGQICNIQISHGWHLYWPDLDMDLSLDIIENPEKYPRIST
jgi:hypothetical protein